MTNNNSLPEQFDLFAAEPLPEASLKEATASDEVVREMNDLYIQLKEASEKYYGLNNQSNMSDDDYDSNLRRLEELEKHYPSLAKDDSPTKTVGALILSSGLEPVTHALQMYSLANAFSEEEMLEFEKQVKGFIETEEVQYIAEPKIDGLAVSITYKNGNFFSAATRGNGIIGENISKNIRDAINIPKELLSDSIPETLEVRGEIYMSHKNFETYNREYQQKKNDGVFDDMKTREQYFANPRNAAAGIVRQLDKKDAKEKQKKRRKETLNLLAFACYGYGVWEGNVPEPETEEAFLALMQEAGLPVAEPNKRCNNMQEMNEFFNELDEKRKTIGFEIDGVVFKINTKRHREIMGSTSKSPRWAIARKFSALSAKTIIEKIEVQVGRTGALTPVAHLRTVNIGGVNVSRATLHNEDEIKRKDVREGDTVWVRRAGDVIPEVFKVELSQRPDSSKEFNMPKNCPVCGGAVRREEGEAAGYCQNISCPKKIHAAIKHFVGRDAMDIDGMGDKLVNTLIQRNVISDIADIFAIPPEQIAVIEGLGKKSASNLMNAISKSSNPEFSRFLFALGIRHVGLQTARAIAEKFETLENFSALFETNAEEAAVEKLCAINDVGQVVAQSIVSFFSDKTNKETLSRLLENITVKKEEKIEGAQGALAGKSIVFTGELETMPRAKAKELARRAGAKTLTTVSSKTDYLVAGKAAGSKLAKAQKLNITVLSEKEFIKIVDEQTETKLF